MTYHSCFSLTLREHEIVERSALGFSAKEIAQQLSIAPRTVERHLENCRLKLHARNRTHLVAICMAGGMVQMKMASMEQLVSL
nr:helix-turn-helix transcriptional regulator [Pelagerythrobacter marensis]